MVFWVRRVMEEVRRRPLDLHLYGALLFLVGAVFVFGYQVKVFWDVVITDKVSLEGTPVFQSLSATTILSDLLWSPFLAATAVGLWLGKRWARSMGLVVGGVTSYMGVQGLLFFPLTRRFGVDAVADFTRYYDFGAYMAYYGIYALVGASLILYVSLRKIPLWETGA